MKAILEFDLDNIDDRLAHLRCVHSSDMASVIFQLTANFRRNCEYKIEAKKPDESEFDIIMEELFKELGELPIPIEELIN